MLEGDKGSWGVEWGATQPPRYVSLKQGKVSRLGQSALARSSPCGGHPPPVQKPARLPGASRPQRSAIAALTTKGGATSPIPPPLATQTWQPKTALWWPNEWSLVAQFENVRRVDALRAALRPPPPEAEPPPPPKKSRQQ